jgi:hypothetical protein
MARVTAVECPHRGTAEVDDPLMFGDVVPQEGHISATAVVTHHNLPG